MLNRALSIAILTGCTLVLAQDSFAQQKVYRYVDKDGKVTYTETPPERLTTPDGRKAAPVKTDEVRIDTRFNVVNPPASQTQIQAVKAREEAVRAAELAANAPPDPAVVEKYLSDAKKAVADAQAPRDDEWQTLVGGRRVPSEAFLQRRAKAEEMLRAAEALAGPNKESAK
jgi:hypothetical protein